MNKAKEAAFDKAVENLTFRAEDLLDNCNHMPEHLCTHKVRLAKACERIRRYFWMPESPGVK